MESPSLNPYENLPFDDQKRFVCVYPAFLNAKKTLVEGRRIAKDKAVDNPTCSEIRDVCSSQGLNCYIENKHYPREQIKDQFHSGRVRVQLRAADGSPVLDNVTNRRELCLLISQMIPKLKTRQGGKAPDATGGQGSVASASSKKKKKQRK